MRAHKSPSCMERSNGGTYFSKKFYSAEEVREIIKSTMTQKLAKMFQEMEEKQQIIKVLNDRLNKNDKKLQEQARVIEHLEERVKVNNYQMTVEIINKIVNDKIGDYWDTVQGKIQGIKRVVMERSEKCGQAMEMAIQNQIREMKAKIDDAIDILKKKNNGYWLKVKETFNRLNSKTQTLQEKLQKISDYIGRLSEERKHQAETVKELRMAKKATKSIVELKKSVDNLYESYQDVLVYQNAFKSEIENQSLSLMGEQKEPSVVRRYPKVEQDIVILEYSKEDDPSSFMYKETGLTEDYYGYQKKTYEHLSPLHTSKSDPKKPMKNSMSSKDFTSLSSFNNDLLMHSQTINLTMQNRKELIESSKERIKELIEQKNLSVPLRVFRDGAKNLKSEEDKYIFDLKGELIKMNSKDFEELERKGTLINVHRKASKSHK